MLSPNLVRDGRGDGGEKLLHMTGVLLLKEVNSAKCMNAEDSLFFQTSLAGSL